jgi:micrococcal nuclease
MSFRYLIYFLLLLFLLSACAAATPTAAPTPTLPPSAGLCIPAGSPRQVARVVDVVDGDTIRVEIDGETYKVRYIGMDTPERDRPFYQEATARNAEMVDGQAVLLVKDVSETDKYDRLLRYVFAGDTFVNFELVNQGYAAAATFPPDVSCDATFRLAETDARSHERGLWAP